MNVTINGSPRELDRQTTLGQLMRREPGVAIALNGVVVPGAHWADTRLREGDVIEIVTARQGG
jgi:sulfur carrier protein